MALSAVFGLEVRAKREPAGKASAPAGCLFDELAFDFFQIYPGLNFHSKNGFLMRFFHE